MVLLMARPTTRAGTQNAQFQKRVPANVLKAARGRRVALSLAPETVGGTPLQFAVTLGTVTRFSLRTDDKALRDLHHGAATQQLEQAFAALLTGPRRISLKEAYELAGVLYHDLNAGFEDNPIDANWWRIVREVAQDALSGAPWPPSDLDNSVRDRRLQALRHRDLRPEAFLLGGEDPSAVAICRFGQARLSNRDLDTAVPSELTRYMSPECLAGAVTPAADWWSFGIILLERLTRGACFAGVNDQAYLMSVVAHGVELAPDIPEDFAELLRGLLFRDRAKRWQWTEVEAWLHGERPQPH